VPLQERRSRRRLEQQRRVIELGYLLLSREVRHTHLTPRTTSYSLRVQTEAFTTHDSFRVAFAPMHATRTCLPAAALNRTVAPRERRHIPRRDP